MILFNNLGDYMYFRKRGQWIQLKSITHFGAQLRKANDCNSVVRSTLLFFFISGGPSGMNLRNYEYSCMGIPSDQFYSQMALNMSSVKNYRVRASSVMSRNEINC